MSPATFEFNETVFRIRERCTVVAGWKHGTTILLLRVLDSYCQIDSSQSLAQLTPARVGIARCVHVRSGASPHVIR